MTTSITAKIRITPTRKKNSCRPSSLPRSFLADARVTRMPAAVEMISAGTCDTRPSPIDSSVNRWSESLMLMPFCAIPMAKPPSTFTIVISTAAIASPRTNLLAPSIAP